MTDRNRGREIQNPYFEKVEGRNGEICYLDGDRRWLFSTKTYGWLQSRFEEVEYGLSGEMLEISKRAEELSVTDKNSTTTWMYSEGQVAPILL